MSMTPTAGSAAPNRSGRCVIARADEQAAVAAAADGELVGTGVFLGDQPFGGGDEIVEHVLLLCLRAGLVPLVAILAAAAQVGDRIDAAHLHPDERCGRRKPGVSEMLKPP